MFRVGDKVRVVNKERVTDFLYEIIEVEGIFVKIKSNHNSFVYLTDYLIHDKQWLRKQKLKRIL